MQTHIATLCFEDGLSISVEVEEGETIHAAALRQNVRLVSDCLEGVCGTCKASCRSARREDNGAGARPTGMRRSLLPCQATVTDDLVIDLPYASDAAPGAGGVQRMECRISRLDRPCASVVVLDIALPAGKNLRFRAGQYAELKVPGASWGRRYSFANSPSDARTLRFYVRLVEGGAMSNHLVANAREGDVLALSGPQGAFRMRSIRRPVLMVAGGTGVAPFLSMLQELRAAPAIAHPVRLLFGMRSPDHAFALTELSELRSTLPGFEPRWSFSEDGTLSSGASIGPVTTLLDAKTVNEGDCDAYLCGPPRMVEATYDWLIAHRVPESQIFIEEFVAS
ncbi:MAG: FAD-binding oxidoreductase [Pirellulales bacterium]